MPSRLHYLQLLSAQAILALAAPQPPYPSSNQSQGIQWSPCGFEEETLPMLCGTLPVPLDYSTPNSTETLTLELSKVPATKQPSLGSILLNFGGPGDEARHTLGTLGSKLNVYTGGHYDLVSFDPRGTGNTLPFSCYRDESEKLISSLNNRVVSGNSSDTAHGELWGISQVYVDTCRNNPNATRIGGIIGTAFTAKDLITVIDALGEDGLLRYWGFSYGTALGATVAAMFPDRVERIILDGVLNIHQYWHDHDIEMYHSTDEAFSGFLEACFEAGDRCALARPNMTASSFESEFYSWLNYLKFHPIPAPGGYLLDYSTVRSWMLGSLYSPRSFPLLAEYINSAMTGNLTAFDESTALASTPAEARIGILCGDKISRASSIEDVLPKVEEVSDLSKLAGDTAAYIVMQCARWRMDAKERYLGDYNVETRHPVLTIGNTYDPVTPFVSAVNASESFPHSVALQHNGFGHTSIAQASVCTVKAIQEYLVNGTMPAPGTVCEIDEPLFSDLTWEDVIPSTIS